MLFSIATADRYHALSNNNKKWKVDVGMESKYLWG